MSKDELKFLLSYQPKNDIFTTKDEMDLICDMMGIDESTSVEELQTKRNEVVSFYSEVMEKEQSSECISHWIPAMQSITAVIDNEKFNKRAFDRI